MTSSSSRTRGSPARRGRRGSTLFEVLFAASISLAVFAVAATFMIRTQEVARHETVHAELDARIMRVLARVADELRGASVDQLIPPEPAGVENELQFLGVLGLEEDGTPIFSAAPIVYRLEPAPGESGGNGRDDNGDGLIDELVLRRVSSEDDPAGPGTVMVTGVKGWSEQADAPALGFRYRRVAGSPRMRIELTVQMRTKEGALIERIAHTGVSLRN